MKRCSCPVHIVAPAGQTVNVQLWRYVNNSTGADNCQLYMAGTLVPK